MFSKFKKFALMFVFCMSIFGVTAFADVNTRSLGMDDKKYFLVCETNSGVFGYTFNTESPTFSISGVTVYEYVDGSWVLTTSSTNLSFGIVSSSTYYTNNQYLYDYVLKSEPNANFNYVNGDGVVVPPTIPPTALEAIAQIVPQLLSQLEVLLPVGVILLSTMLGVSLVRRLVPLFL